MRCLDVITKVTENQCSDAWKLSLKVCFLRYIGCGYPEICQTLNLKDKNQVTRLYNHHERNMENALYVILHDEIMLTLLNIEL